MTTQELKKRLQEAFQDGSVEVTDLTGTEDHYEVSVQSNLFQGLNRVQQHQKVMSALAPELKSGEIHALSIRTQLN